MSRMKFDGAVGPVEGAGVVSVVGLGGFMNDDGLRREAWLYYAVTGATAWIRTTASGCLAEAEHCGNFQLNCSIDAV